MVHKHTNFQISQTYHQPTGFINTNIAFCADCGKPAPEVLKIFQEQDKLQNKIAEDEAADKA